MKYQVTEIVEGVRLHEQTPDAHLIGVTQTTIERIIKLSDCPGEAMALYLFYAYTCKWQKNSCAFATAKFVQKHFGWGRDKFQKAKNSLKEMGLIEDEKRRGERNKIVGHYIKVRYASTTTTEIHPVDSPASGKQTTDTMYSNGDTSNSHVHAIDSHKSGTPVQDVRSNKEIFPSKAKDTARTRKSKAAPQVPTTPECRVPPPPMEIRCNECDIRFVTPDPLNTQFCDSCAIKIAKQRQSEDSWAEIENAIA